MSRLTNSALRTAESTWSVAGSHHSSWETKSRPRPHGTYSWGNHSGAVAMWRSSSRTSTGWISDSISGVIFIMNQPTRE